MINYFSHINFILPNQDKYSEWIKKCLNKFDFQVNEINYIFVDDQFLYDLNLKYLNHDTLTDIITFDYTDNKQILTDIYISIDRIKENAKSFNTTFENELSRVMIHGLLHIVGLDDKTPELKLKMREQENICLNQLFD